MSKPDFIIAGERRSGSTTLYHLLDGHPQISMLKPVDYDHFIEKELFSLTPISSSTRVQPWTDDCMQDYFKRFQSLEGTLGQKDADLLWWYPTHQRLARNLPDCKFVFVLREPVSRAISQYFNELKKGREDRDIEIALAITGSETNWDWNHLHREYLQRGKYARSLTHFLQFIPAERVLVVILEELNNNWEYEMKRIAEFLEVDATPLINMKPLHTNKEAVLARRGWTNFPIVKPLFDFWDRATEAVVVRRYQVKEKRDGLRRQLRGWYYYSVKEKISIPDKLMQSMRDFYKESNKELEELLGITLKYW